MQPIARKKPKRSGAAMRDLNGTIRKDHEERDDGKRADQAELFAENREDEVGILLGQIEELRARCAQSDAEDAAAAEREQRLHDVKARCSADPSTDLMNAKTRAR